MMMATVPRWFERVRLHQPSVLLVVALLIASAVLITAPALRAPSAADVCNASEPGQDDKLAAEKESAAALVAFGAVVSFVAAAVAFHTARRGNCSDRRSLISLGILGGLGGLVGLYVAFVTVLIVC